MIVSRLPRCAAHSAIRIRASREVVANSIDQLGLPLIPSPIAVCRRQAGLERGSDAGKNALEPLLNAVHDQVGKVRQDVIQTLGLIGDPSVVEVVRAFLADDDGMSATAPSSPSKNLRARGIYPQR